MTPSHVNFFQTKKTKIRKQAQHGYRAWVKTTVIELIKVQGAEEVCFKWPKALKYNRNLKLGYIHN